MLINEIRPLVNIVDPKLGLAINTFIELFEFFNSSFKRSSAVEVIERRAADLIKLLTFLKEKDTPYYKEHEIRLLETLLLLEQIKNG